MTHTSPTRSSLLGFLLLMILVGLNLRPALSSLAPVLARIQADTGLSPTSIGALTTLPVVCLGLFAPLAPWLAKRVGAERALISGRWPFAWAILALALGNVLTLVIGGSPWGITFAFNLWGAKALQAVGVDMSQFEFWTWDYPAMALKDSVLVNITSVMNFGLLLGAMLAAGLANRFNEASRKRPEGRPFLAAVIGGLLLGYGARLGFGCNIGALFSGIGSASLHAWIWFASAFLGSLIGIRLRPWFRLPN